MSLRLNPPCRVPWRWALGLSERSRAAAVQTQIARGVWRARTRSRRRLQLLGVFALWPLLALGAAHWGAVRWGGYARRRSGIGRPQQVLMAWGLALRDAVPPTSYYRYRLYEPEKRGRALDYLHRSTTKNAAVYPLLRRPPFCRARALSDKGEFWQRCLTHGLPAVPVLLQLEDGMVVRPAEPGAALPAGDLFVKPLRSKGGRGAARWDWAPEGHYRSPEGETCTPRALLERLCRASRQQALLVQPRVVNHPALLDLTNGALATVRILSCRNERGEAEPAAAVFRMPVGENRVCDNIHAGGIAAGVELASGRLGRAAALDPASDWLTSHPDTGARIAGRLLPDWDAALDLVRRAGAVFDDFAVVGWDVALTKEGPLVVEGNTAPCVDLMQRPLDRGLAAGRFGELLARNLEHVLAG